MKFDFPASKETAIDSFYQKARRFGLEYGPDFQGLVRLACEEGEAWGHVELPKKVEMDGELIHPSLLDACFQTMIAALKDEGKGDSKILLPVGLKRFELHHVAGRKASCHAKLMQTDTEEILKGDLVIFGEDGKPTGVLRELLFRYVDRNTFMEDVQRDEHFQPLYEPYWKRKAVPEGPEKRKLRMVVFSDDARAEEFANEMRKLGNFVVSTANDCENLQGLFEKSPPTDIVVFHGHEFSDAAGPDLDRVMKETDKLRSILRGYFTHSPDSKTNLFLWTVTRGTQSVQGEPPADLSLGMLWGAAASASLENGSLRHVCVDMPSDRDEMRLLSREIVHEDAENQIAYREGVRFVRRLREY